MNKTILAVLAIVAFATFTNRAFATDTNAATIDQVAYRLNNAMPVGFGQPPTWTPSDCDSFIPVLQYHGATDTEISFFVPRILERESGCGRDILNESTGDSGPCQINPVHNVSGYFGGTHYADGGWLDGLHGLRVRHNLTDSEWLAACLTLFRVCGTGPWAPPYSCANRTYP